MSNKVTSVESRERQRDRRRQSDSNIVIRPQKNGIQEQESGALRQVGGSLNRSQQLASSNSGKVKDQGKPMQKFLSKRNSRNGKWTSGPGQGE